MNPLAAIVAILAFYSAYSHSHHKHEENSKNLREVKISNSASIENKRSIETEFSLEEAKMPAKGGKGGKGGKGKAGKGKGKLAEYEGDETVIDVVRNVTEDIIEKIGEIDFEALSELTEGTNTLRNLTDQIVEKIEEEIEGSFIDYLSISNEFLFIISICRNSCRSEIS